MAHASKLTQTIGLLSWLGIVLVAATLGAVASIEAKSFYEELAKPVWAPPAWVFGPVWSALYILMGAAVWLTWREKDAPGRLFALALFLVQLAANVIWSWLFFAWKNGAFAFADVLVLLALIAATIAAFWRIQHLAAVLLIPYLAWVGFASALTWAVWQNNPGLL
jgi:tryptophan-rich sensory protein